MTTTSLADNLAKIGDPIEGNDSVVASGIGYDIVGFIVFGTILIVVGLAVRSAVRKSDETRLDPPAARNPGEATRFIDKLRNALTSTRSITPANLAAADTADFATFAPDHGPITIHSTRLGQKKAITIPLADGRGRSRTRSALNILTSDGRTPLGPVLRTGTPPTCTVPVTPATASATAAPHREPQ